MKKLIPLLIIAGLILVSMAATGFAQEKKEAKLKYVGLGSCKPCHSNAKIGGEEYKVYEKSGHAKAFATLKGEEAKKIAKAKGIADPTKSDACLKCHVTACGLKDQQDAKYSQEEGVTCEACHGPGEKYRNMNIMKDPALAKQNGLLTPNEKTCLKCHNQESPTYKPFDYKTMWKKIEHGKKPAAAK